MDYFKALSYCESFAANKSSMSLENMKTLLGLLGNPHEKVKHIHIAGTNGKGSVVSFIAEILTTSGLKVGKFVSPHLMRINERFSIDGQDIDDNEFTSCVAEIKKAITGHKELKNSLTMFEIMTCVAFLHFNKNDCDIAVLETGLGGRFDATNVIQNPLLTVITMIGFDHTKVLGDTIERIAFEKACIIKKSSMCVIAPQKYIDALSVLEKHAENQGVEPILVDKSAIVTKERSASSQIFDYKNLKELKITLLGNHQTENAATAVEAVSALGKLGFDINKEAIYKGLERAKWPCRLEVVNTEPITIIDGAHNVDGVMALSGFLRDTFRDKKITYIFGVMKDKNYKAMIQEIKHNAKEVYLIEMQYYRAENIDILKSVLNEYGIASRTFATLEDAIDYSYRQLSKDDIVCIFGSLYLVGDAKNIFLP